MPKAYELRTTHMDLSRLLKADDWRALKRQWVDLLGTAKRTHDKVGVKIATAAIAECDRQISTAAEVNSRALRLRERVSGQSRTVRQRPTTNAHAT